MQSSMGSKQATIELKKAIDHQKLMDGIDTFLPQNLEEVKQQDIQLNDQKEQENEDYSYIYGAVKEDLKSIICH